VGIAGADPGGFDELSSPPNVKPPTKKIARVIEATRAILCFELLAAAFALPPVIRPGIAIASESRSTLCGRSVALLWSLIGSAETIAIADKPTIEVAPGAAPVSPEETPAGVSRRYPIPSRIRRNHPIA